MASGYPSASIVIPTYNRVSDLQRVIAAVSDQQRPVESELEVVVVDDGSSDGTSDWLDQWQGRCELTALRQENSGPARARNHGASVAKGDVVLFLGDDTVPQAGWLLAHLEEHRLFGGRGAVAVLGYTSFPGKFDTPFLRFINEMGSQFGYQLIDEPRAVPFNFFYTSNISVPRAFFIENGGFREDVPAAAWEDIEFAYRAAANGLRIVYQPRARTIHHHRIRPRTFCRRQRTSGRSAAIFAGLHPELEEFLGVFRTAAGSPSRGLKVLILGAFVELGEWIPLPIPPGVYLRFVDLCYQRGLARGLQE
jgi:GT2 family glycosyltransferase